MFCHRRFFLEGADASHCRPDAEIDATRHSYSSPFFLRFEESSVDLRRKCTIKHTSFSQRFDWRITVLSIPYFENSTFQRYTYTHVRRKSVEGKEDPLSSFHLSSPTTQKIFLLYFILHKIKYNPSLVKPCHPKQLH